MAASLLVLPEYPVRMALSPCLLPQTLPINVFLSKHSSDGSEHQRAKEPEWQPGVGEWLQRQISALKENHHK